MNDSSDPQKSKTGPRDVFLHLLAIITLYFAAGSFLALLFQYINLSFPDPALEGDFYSAARAYGAIRFALSSLIIVFPVYVLTTRYLNRLYVREPEKLNLRTRKWLLYFTLFAAALIIIGDLVALVNSLLSGELTVRFVLKVLTVFFVAGSAFSYYFLHLRQAQTRVMTYVAGAVIAIVAVAVVAGFFVVGSPREERLRRIDERRVQDLQGLQSEILFYWQSKERLPGTLAGLQDNIRGYNVPVDPETGQAYGYEVTGELAFRLCASFNGSSFGNDALRTKPLFPPDAPSPTSLDYGYGGSGWAHPAGMFCFDREIDPELYPPRKPPT